ncbi:MAG: hypothetical protein COA73_05935 [Candidatus Hydrogenedentota bacterium]|nr:MAG: hypothetical protein COA73_05935 [Candidatus Hydrogenedentota bacterium]
MDKQHHITPEQYELLVTHAQIGRTINGLAHDVNNYLGVIMAYAELIDAESNLNPDCQRMIREMTDAVELSSRMLDTLTTISLKNSERIAQCDVPELIDGVAALFSYELNLNRIDVTKNIDLKHITLRINEPKLQRIFMYLVVAAIEIAKESKCSSLLLSAYEQDQYVTLSVGLPGIDLGFQVSQGLFDSFYTFPDSNRMIVGLESACELAASLGGELTVDKQHGLQVVLDTSNLPGELSQD